MSPVTRKRVTSFSVRIT